MKIRLYQVESFSIAVFIISRHNTIAKEKSIASHSTLFSFNIIPEVVVTNAASNCHRKFLPVIKLYRSPFNAKRNESNNLEIIIMLTGFFCNPLPPECNGSEVDEKCYERIAY